MACRTKVPHQDKPQKATSQPCPRTHHAGMQQLAIVPLYACFQARLLITRPFTRQHCSMANIPPGKIRWPNFSCVHIEQSQKFFNDSRNNKIHIRRWAEMDRHKFGTKFTTFLDKWCGQSWDGRNFQTFQYDQGPQQVACKCHALHCLWNQLRMKNLFLCNLRSHKQMHCKLLQSINGGPFNSWSCHPCARASKQALQKTTHSNVP